MILGLNILRFSAEHLKKQFGVPPNICRGEKLDLDLVKKATVVERNIINYQGSLTLKGTFEYMEELRLEGTYFEANEDSSEFESLLISKGDAFLCESQKADWLIHEMFYAVVNCHGKDDGRYTVFYGMKAGAINLETAFNTRIVPEGWYAKFIYCGDMFDIRGAFTDDLYRWVMVREIELNPNGVGMLNIFNKNYPVTSNVQILVPVKAPK
jgi:AraC family transcriptional regulator